MRLMGSAYSPFVRKVRVLMLELGLKDRFELVPVDTYDPRNGLEAFNPLRKVPALVLDNGACLYDSPVICEWLCDAYREPEMLPQGDSRWRVLVTQALADGTVDAAGAARIENMRPVGEQSPAFRDKQMATMWRCLETLAYDAAWREGGVNLAQIAVGCTLGWLAFRFPDEDWRKRFPALEDWERGFAERLSMQKTMPV